MCLSFFVNELYKPDNSLRKAENIRLKYVFKISKKGLYLQFAIP